MMRPSETGVAFFWHRDCKSFSDNFCCQLVVNSFRILKFKRLGFETGIKGEVMIKQSVWFCAAVIAFTSAAAYALDDGSSSAAAEDALFEDIPIVVSSSFFKTKATKAPGNTVLITHEQIVDSPARTMDDLIEYYVPGMIVAEHEFSGSILASRGVGVDNNAKTLLLYD